MDKLSVKELEELKQGVSNICFIAFSKLTDKEARQNIVNDGNRIQSLIDDAIAQQSVTDADAQIMIDDLKQLRIALVTSTCDGKRIIDMLSPAITALEQYRKPEPCGWCDLEKTEKIYAYGMSFKRIPVRYCPNCGRRLKAGE